jgi:hypothetical protein
MQVTVDTWNYMIQNSPVTNGTDRTCAHHFNELRDLKRKREGRNRKMKMCTAVGPTQPPIQWIPGTLSLCVKRPGHEADHLLPSSAEVKNA